MSAFNTAPEVAPSPAVAPKSTPAPATTPTVSGIEQVLASQNASVKNLSDEDVLKIIDKALHTTIPSLESTTGNKIRVHRNMPSASFRVCESNDYSLAAPAGFYWVKDGNYSGYKHDNLVMLSELAERVAAIKGKAKVSSNTINAKVKKLLVEVNDIKREELFEMLEKGQIDYNTLINYKGFTRRDGGECRDLSIRCNDCGKSFEGMGTALYSLDDYNNNRESDVYVCNKCAVNYGACDDCDVLIAEGIFDYAPLKE